MLRSIRNNLYYFVFAILKHFKFPTCKLYTNHIHHTAKIGKFVEIHKYCRIDKNVTIGDYTFINEYTRIDSNTAKIGRYCSISHNVKIGMGPHPSNFVSTSTVFYSKSRGFVEKDLYDEYEAKGFTIIEDDVLIGANVVILAGVKIGTGAIVASGSVVTKNVEPYSIAGGVPAKLIRKRFDDFSIKKLLASKWWDQEPNELKHMNDILKFMDFKNEN